MDKEEIKKLIEEVNKEKENDGEQKANKASEMNDLVKSLGDKIAEAIASAKSSNKEVPEALKKFVANETSLNGVKYPALEKLSSLSKDEKIMYWFKSLVNRKKETEAEMVFKALNEGTDAEGGYMVPTELRAEIFRILPNFAVMRRIARVITMSSQTMDLTTLVAAPEAYWTAEYGSKSTTSAEFGRVTLTANDLVCLLPVTHQLIDDANIDIVNLIIQLFAEAIAKAEDKAFFRGTGTGQPKGIAAETLGKTIASNGSASFDTVASLYYGVPQRVRQSSTSAFVAHSYVISILRQMKDSDNRYIWEPSVQVGMPDRIFGKPIYEQNDLAQTELYFGDWSYYIIGDRKQITVTTTDEGGDAWRRNATEIKAVERVDGRMVLAKAFGKITNFK